MKLSVIVPVYGVEKYIARCAESLFGQTYADKEIIFVDDASPDRSLVILQNVLVRYTDINVRILHHSVNRGLAAARKTGIEAATGEYIVSVDSDDYLESCALELLVAEAERTGADIIGMDCYFEWNGKRSRYRGAWSSNPQEYSRILLSGRTLPGVCLHMIRKSLYTRTGIMPVDGLNNGEDYLITPRLCWYANRIARVEQPLYCYNQTNASSIVHNLSHSHIVQLKQVVDILTEFFSDKQDCAEALRAGQWLKKTDTMMQAKKTDYALVDTMPGLLPLSTATMTNWQRPAAWLIARRQWTMLWLYSRCYGILMETVQILKGRRKKC
jgi:glycosyltransferase involved in cell wall biosynthesis